MRPARQRPDPAERRTCGPFLARELALVRPQVVVVLGAFGWQALLTHARRAGLGGARAAATVRARRRAGASPGRAVAELVLLGCFHVSQQNTFTGRLTPAMLDAVLVRARDLSGVGGRG